MLKSPQPCPQFNFTSIHSKPKLAIHLPNVSSFESQAPDGASIVKQLLRIPSSSSRDASCSWLWQFSCCAMELPSFSSGENITSGSQVAELAGFCRFGSLMACSEGDAQAAPWLSVGLSPSHDCSVQLLLQLSWSRSSTVFHARAT